MANLFTERQKAILDYVRRNGTAKPDELAEALHVSAPTIRRDLSSLHEARAIARFHGGVAHLEDMARRPFAERRAENQALKQAIAQDVIARIPAGSSIFLGTGTTMEQVASFLPSDRALTVVTPSIFCAATLVNRQGVDLHVLGGRAIGSEGNLSGIEPMRALQALRFDLALVSFAGMDKDGTPMDFDIEHRPIKETAIGNARLAIAAVDHTKFGRSALVRVGRLEDIDVLITSAEPPADIRAALTAAGVELVATAMAA